MCLFVEVALSRSSPTKRDLHLLDADGYDHAKGQMANGEAND
jgi:hypothetical protein